MNKLVAAENEAIENDWTSDSLLGLPLIYSPLLQKQAVLKHAFTTRRGGKSEPPLHDFNLGRHMASADSRADAMRNRQALCAALSLSFADLTVPACVHSNNVAFVEDKQTLSDVDGVVTDQPHLPLMLHFADCVPVVIFDPVKRVLALVHAGWRGTAQRIAVEAIAVMQERCGSNPSQMVAAIGPAIGACCYPTGADVGASLKNSLTAPDGASDATDRSPWVASAFVENGQGTNPHLKAINAAQLWQAGVRHIDVSNLCTACRPDLFYSHRQSGGATGRQAIIASIG